MITHIFNSPPEAKRRQNKFSQYLGKIFTIKAWTIIYSPPIAFKKSNKYTVVMVSNEDGTHLYGRLVSIPFEKKILCGEKVKATLRILSKGENSDIITYAIAFILL